MDSQDILQIVGPWHDLSTTTVCFLIKCVEGYNLHGGHRAELHKAKSLTAYRYDMLDRLKMSQEFVIYVGDELMLDNTIWQIDSFHEIQLSATGLLELEMCVSSKHLLLT